MNPQTQKLYEAMKNLIVATEELATIVHLISHEQRLAINKAKDALSNFERSVYPIGGFAPGSYLNICITCKKEFIGDKMAVQCEECATKMVKQSQQEENKTAEEILDQIHDNEYRSNYKTDYSKQCIIKAMSEYASQQTAHKDQKITDLSGELHATDKLNQELQDEIVELKEAISELIQVKDWKDKYGKDEHYLKAMPIAWENARKLIQK